MPRTALAIQDVVIGGLNPVFTAANVDGHSVPATGRHFVYVKNAGASPITVTVPTPATLAGRAVADDTATVPNASERIIGPFKGNLHGQVAGGVDAGLAYIDFSAVTSVTCAAFRLP